MPRRPKKQCGYKTCTEVQRDLYCAEHKIIRDAEATRRKLSYDKKRPNSHQRGYDGSWRKA